MRSGNAVARRTPAPVLAATLAAIAISAAGGVTDASATPQTPFYVAPAEIPAEPGSIIRTESMPAFLTVPRSADTASPRDAVWPGTAQRILYTSLTQEGTPTAVSGTFLEPSGPWRGKGAAPVVVIGPGAIGQGDHCAPSLAFSTGGYIPEHDPMSFSPNQEAASAAYWSALGAKVVVTDYVGMGTPGIHTYTNRIEYGRAILDAGRAAIRVSRSASDTPMVLWGYSQGGGATASAAELQPTYSPELNIKGAWAGAPPADLVDVLAEIDGALIGGVIGWAVNSIVAHYPELKSDLQEKITPTGKQLLETMSNECIGDVISRHAFFRTESIMRDGRSLLDNVRSTPESMKVFVEQRIGNIAPEIPVLVTSGRNDDSVPYGQVREMASDWCDRGATVDFRTNELPPILPGATLPNHFGPQLIDGYSPDGAIQFLLDRLDDKPIHGCSMS
ncbi:lipase family protein [Gordonia sp. LSe1-13]|uniref:Lipase family protein n=1 Tax=Gordonia sesuvii TaxID=3116777 RepID=A0ABU7MIR5_9ACTN|nr:lipase family protein [Gordonia sp. LSe1-13]